MHIAKEFKFEAAHQLHDPSWTAEENFYVFGKCSHLHGHSYRIEVQVGHEVDPVKGWVMDYTDLKAIVNAAVIDRWDHQFLNEVPPWTDVPSLKTTAENIALAAWPQIETEMQRKGFGYVLLERVRVSETATTFAEVSR